MAADDPRRVHGVLPKRVDWLHFWAHYDPVATGPLTASSLPRPDAYTKQEMKDLYTKLAGRLDECRNIDVVNTDSTFTDHTTYWQNMEEVVGPIARELVRGHPNLERVVEAHVATPDDILIRRCQVAARTLALVVGFGLGVALLLWDSSQDWHRVGKTLDTSILQLIGALLGSLAFGFGAVVGDLKVIITKLTGGASLPIKGLRLDHALAATL